MPQPLLLLLHIFFFLFSFQFPSSLTLSDTYFLNCGSSTPVTVDNRTFVADSNSSFLSAPSSTKQEDQDRPQNSELLYQTARVFTRQSSYKFNLQGNGTLVVRLHFFPFSSQDYNLSSAAFDVSVSGLQLLSNFNVQSNSSATLKEYFLKPVGNKLEISFTPSTSSSFAFVNAIEVFSAPDGLLVDTASSMGGNHNGLLEQALESVYRINVGGPKVPPTNDTVWRTWIPDDHYLKSSYAAIKAGPTASTIKYDEAGVSREIAPDIVYRTARVMNRDDRSPANEFNLTWTFAVNSSNKHLVRLHFCDIVSDNPNGPNKLVFNVYIAGYARHSLDLSQKRLLPVHEDYIVDPDNSEYINVSIAPTAPGKNATLNGVEIMKVHAVKGPVAHPQKHRTLLIGLSIGGVALICVVLVVCLLAFKCKKRNEMEPERRESLMWSPLTAYRESTHTKTTERTMTSVSPHHINLGLILSFVEIQSATDNFNTNSLIGSGGFGDVYKGVLRDGRKVAVKRGKPGSSQGKQEFLAEITVLSKIYHRHLVSLIGYCLEQSEMILAYEFMEKGTLRDHLYGKDLPCLSWKQRLEICVGSARGIHYLHTFSGQGIIHRDVKSANILLDENYLAKVADFGLSRAVPAPEQSGVSLAIKGTFGFIDPEYYRRHHLTMKSDVFSFGVVLLEVLCARPAIDHSLPTEQVNLAEWALEWQKKGLLAEIIDPRLAGMIDPNSLRKFGETVEGCLAECGDDRPTMGDVLWNLEYALQLQETAVYRKSHEDSTMSVSESQLPSVRRLPSTTTTIRSEHQEKASDGSTGTSASMIFSQLIGSDGR